MTETLARPSAADGREQETRRIWLVRHGATAWTGWRWCGRTDLPLSRLGHAQVRRLVAQLRDQVPLTTRILSSPLRRAMETAAPFAATLPPPEIVADLREIDFGAAEGLTWPELEASWPAVAEAIVAGRGAIDWPDGESARSIVARAKAVARRLAASSEPLIVVTHGAFAGALIDALVGSVGTDVLRPFLEPASALVLRAGPSGWTIDAGDG